MPALVESPPTKAKKFICRGPGCTRAIGKSIYGLCKAHVHQQLRGNPLVPLRDVVPAEDRFWSKVDKNGPVHPVLGTACWVWLAGRQGHMGYGSFRVTSKRKRAAHKYAWEMKFGTVPKGLCVLHRCDNPPCVNDAHFFLGTDMDNVVDRERKGRGRKGRTFPNERKK